MKRTQIYLTELEHQKVKEKADKLGLSMTEVIRRIIDLHFEIEEHDDNLQV